MPEYLYLCDAKHGEFYCVHSIKEKLEFCPKCEEEKLPPQKITRLICGGGSFILSGGGWAREGYSNK